MVHIVKFSVVQDCKRLYRIQRIFSSLVGQRGKMDREGDLLFRFNERG
jgi:hypothetical protein